MNKRKYEAPKIVVHGDVKKITLAGGDNLESVDQTWTTYDTDGTPTGHTTWS